MTTFLKWTARVFAGLILLAVGLYVLAGWYEKPLDAEARMDMPGRLLQLEDGALHYRWDGLEDGPVIVMVHGLTTPHFIFEQNSMALVAAGFRVLRFDHFGRGWSDRPDGPYDTDFYDRALLQLLDGLGIAEPVGLVGLSMGGRISAEFAARHPERVSKLFLFVPAGLDLVSADSPLNRLMLMPGIGDWMWRLASLGALFGPPSEDTSVPPENRLMGDATQQLNYAGFGKAVLSTLRHLPLSGQDKTYSNLAQTGIPVRAVFGDQDLTVALSSTDRLRGLVPDADIRVVTTGAHTLNYENHAEVNPWLVEWFSR